MLVCPERVPAEQVFRVVPHAPATAGGSLLAEQVRFLLFLFLQVHVFCHEVEPFQKARVVSPSTESSVQNPFG